MAAAIEPNPATIAAAAAKIAPALVDALKDHPDVVAAAAKAASGIVVETQPSESPPNASQSFRGQFTVNGARRFLRTLGIIVATLAISKLARLDSDHLSELLNGLATEGAIPAGVVGLANFAYQLWKKDDRE